MDKRRDLVLGKGEVEMSDVKIKKLAWEQISSRVWRAGTMLGYFAEVKSHSAAAENFYVSSPVIDAIYAEDQPDLASAMDCAQADFDRRVRECLE